MSELNQAERTDKIWIKNCFQKPGEHILIGGQTGSGKTQTLYFILARILKHSPDEAIIWFDTGKASEMLVLAEMKPLKVFHPRGTRIEPNTKPDKTINEIEYYPFEDTIEILHNLSRDKINVVSIEPFYPRADQYTKALESFFNDLINLAMKYDLITPLSIFIDELHYIAPGQGQGLNAAHQRAAMHMQRNIERLRALEVRIVGAVQDWTKIRRGVRQAFSWIIAKRGIMFTARDVPQLSKYNNKFWNLSTNSSIWIFPDKHFAPVYIEMPFYGDGKKIGKVRYYQ